MPSHFKILAVSDTPALDLAAARDRFQDLDLIISCGDLPYPYLDEIFNALEASLFFVHGNHDAEFDWRPGPEGGQDLHRRVRNLSGLLLAGVEGSLFYKEGAYQYTQGEMFRHVLALAPGLLLNRFHYGRFLDIFVSHAPPEGIHDKPDRPHQGIKAFRWLLRVFQPAFHLHGHIHVYRKDTVRQTKFRRSQVINAYGFREINITIPSINA